MRFKRAKGGIVEIGPEALSVMWAHRQITEDSTEAGGILLGRVILNSSDLVIDEATPPSCLDRRSRYGIWRARGPAQRRVRQAWRESGGTRVYLGEWHTHPEDVPSGPSKVDRPEWLRLLRETKGEQDQFFFIIVGRHSLRIWQGEKDSGALTELMVVTNIEACDGLRPVRSMNKE